METDVKLTENDMGIERDERIHATIITGFLGSGKTTLLNHILTVDHGKRIAVIENEYGEVDIDGSLVAAKTTVAEDIIMLNNGCLCCTVRGDLVRMIAELVNKKKGTSTRTLQEDGEGSQESQRNPPSETELFLETTGGFLPSGTVLGLGSATQLFYEKPIRGKISSVSSTQSRAVTDLKEQIEIQARLLEKANRRAEADRGAHAKELEETKKQMETKLEATGWRWKS